jgi:hypothetical protein
VTGASVLCALALAGVAAGGGRLAGLLPLLAGLVCHRRLAALAPLPGAVCWAPRSGWCLLTADGPVSVQPGAGSWFGRSRALVSFRCGGQAGEGGKCGGAGRRWLVPLRRPRGSGAEDWRRLRMLWRTSRGALVENSPNC